MKILPRILAYGLVAIALVASSLLFRTSTPVAEAQCNFQPNHACTHDNDNNFNDNFGTLTVDNFNNNKNNDNNYCADNPNQCSE